MKIQTKRQKERVEKILNKIKSMEEAKEYCSLQELSKVVTDLKCFHKTMYGINDIEKKWKKNKYESFQDLIGELRGIFIGLSDYHFQDDPIQLKLAKIISQIDIQQAKFLEKFKKRNKQKERNSHHIDFEEQAPVQEQFHRKLIEKAQSIIYITDNRHNAHLMYQLERRCGKIEQNDMEVQMMEQEGQILKKNENFTFSNQFLQRQTEKTFKRHHITEQYPNKQQLRRRTVRTSEIPLKLLANNNEKIRGHNDQEGQFHNYNQSFEKSLKSDPLRRTRPSERQTREDQMNLSNRLFLQPLEKKGKYIRLEEKATLIVREIKQRKEHK